MDYVDPGGFVQGLTLGEKFPSRSTHLVSRIFTFSEQTRCPSSPGRQLSQKKKKFKFLSHSTANRMNVWLVAGLEGAKKTKIGRGT